MPGNAPPVPDEHSALRDFLVQQHAGIRNAAFGLTDEQAHATPSTSAISIASLVKHVTFCEQGWMDRVHAAPASPSPTTGRSRSRWPTTGRTGTRPSSASRTC